MRREGRRVVAILVPDLPLQRTARSRASLEPGRPLAVVSEGRILCRDAAAAAEGVRPGATPAEALAACGRLAHVPADPAADGAALRALAEAMIALAPAVELAPPDALLLDASAVHLISGRARPAVADGAGTGGAAREGEEILAARALAVAAEMGYAAQAAVATGRGPARALARHGRGPVAWTPPDGAADAIGTLPIAALGVAPEVAARLAALGIESAGALARLPEGALAHRFGEEGVLAARLARGEDASPLVPFVPQALPEETLDLEGPAESADPLLFALKRLADRVAVRLAGRGLGASRLEISLRLDSEGGERLIVPLAAPTAAPERWLLPVKERIFSLTLPAPVAGVRLAVTEVAPLAAEQLAIGDRPEALAALEAVLTRLAGRLGGGAIFAAQRVERHRPEAAYRAVPFPSRGCAPKGRRGGGAPARRGRAEGRRTAVEGQPGPPHEAPRPTRLLAAPSRIVAEGEGGRVTALRVDGRARSIVAIEGPERLRGEWWAGPFDRDYYRVRLEGVGDCWVYRDGRDGALYLHGFFD